ncbi:hypothetical protein DM40_2585 [Burkholderia cenocepacia]|nr:hypothetical protein DM40_2585 [Burkholderia cenocepacia]
MRFDPGDDLGRFPAGKAAATGPVREAYRFRKTGESNDSFAYHLCRPLEIFADFLGGPQSNFQRYRWFDPLVQFLHKALKQFKFTHSHHRSMQHPPMHRLSG